MQVLLVMGTANAVSVMLRLCPSRAADAKAEAETNSIAIDDSAPDAANAKPPAVELARRCARLGSPDLLPRRKPLGAVPD